MEDQALQHIMNVQTQMLQHLTNLQQQQSQQNITTSAQQISGQMNPNIQGAATSFGTPLPGSIASPVVPPSIDPSAAPGTLAMSVSDPTKYGTYAAPYIGNGRPVAAQINSQAKGFLSNTIAQMKEFDGTQSSKEATDQFISQQSRGVQEGAASFLGGAMKGAVTAGSFFIPGGIVASLAAGTAATIGVGGVASAIQDETRIALDYQDVLQKKSYRFLNAFESTNDMGGIGMGLSDRQQLSGFLRDLAPEKFLEDKDMMKILDGAADNNLLKTVSDVKSFKKKFTEVVDAVKEISVTMNQSIEEATRFMGELESRGISTKDMSYIAARNKTMSSMLGVSATEGAQLVLQGTDAITNGTSLNSNLMMQATQESMYVAQRVQDTAQVNNPELYNLIKNSGGAGSLGSQYQQMGRNFIRSDRGTEMLLGYYGSAVNYNQDTGDFEIDNKKMNELLSGNVSANEMYRSSMSNINSMSADQKYRLQSQIGTLFSNYASDSDMNAFLGRSADVMKEMAAQTGENIDIKTALMEAGIANDYEQAQLLEAMIRESTNPASKRSFNAKAIKEEMDSHAISNSPGIFKRIGFWWDRNITNNIGDVGQWGADFAGDKMMEYEKFITGIDDRSTVNADHLYSFSKKGVENIIDDLEVVNKSSEKIQKEYGYDSALYNREAKINTKKMKEQLNLKGDQDFSAEAFVTYLDDAKKGTLDPATLSRISEDKHLGVFGDQRAQLVRDVASGEYRGFLGKFQYGMDRANIALVNGTEWAYDKTIQPLVNLWNGDTKELEEAGSGEDTLDSLEKQKDKLQGERNDINDETMKLFGSGKLGENQDELKAIQEAIRSGDVKGVQELTGNKSARKLADRYKTLLAREKDFGKSMDKVDELTKMTKAITGSGTQLGDVLNASGVYSEAELDDLLGDLRTLGKDTKKGIKDKDLSATEMVQANRDALNQVDKLFASMPEYDLHKLADYLLKKDQSIKIEDFYKKGTETIDANAVQSYLMDNVIRETNLKGDGDSKGKKGKGDTGKAAKEHEEAMTDFLIAFQNETEMLRNATYGRPVANSNQTSLGTR